MGGNDLQFNNGAMVIKTVAGVAGAVTAAPTDPCCCDTTSSCWYHYTVEFFCGASPHWGTVTFIEKTCAASAPGPTSWTSITPANPCDFKFEIWVMGGACAGVGDCPDPSVGDYPAHPTSVDDCPCTCWYHFRVKWICCDGAGGHWGTVEEITGDRACQPSAPGPTAWTKTQYVQCDPGDAGSPDIQFDIWMIGVACDSIGVCPDISAPPPPSVTPTCTCPCTFNPSGAEVEFEVNLTLLTYQDSGGGQEWSSPTDYANANTLGPPSSPCPGRGYTNDISRTPHIVNWTDSATGHVPYGGDNCTLRDKTLWDPTYGTNPITQPYVDSTCPDNLIFSYSLSLSGCVAVCSTCTGDCVGATLIIGTSINLFWNSGIIPASDPRNCRWVIEVGGCQYFGPSTPLTPVGDYAPLSGVSCDPPSGTCSDGGSGWSGTVHVS